MNSRMLIVLMIISCGAIAACKDDTTSPQRDCDSCRESTCEVAWPAEWHGVWSTSGEGRACGTDTIYAIGAADEVICAGESIRDFFDLDPAANCDITATGTKVTVNSSYSYEDPELGCSVTETLTTTLTLNENTITSTYRYEEKTATNCEHSYAYCVDLTFEGTRTSEGTAECSASLRMGTAGFARGIQP
jgi:hypothetical protein